MPKTFRSPRFSGQALNLDLARVLLVHGELAPRLALRTILQAGGYAVDVAASTSEALAKLDEGVYDLVLTDQHFARGRAGRDLLAYARVKEYRPATALVTSYRPEFAYQAVRRKYQVSVHTENLVNLLSDVAELIGMRASRRYRPLRPAY